MPLTNKLSSSHAVSQCFLLPPPQQEEAGQHIAARDIWTFGVTLQLLQGFRKRKRERKYLCYWYVFLSFKAGCVSFSCSLPFAPPIFHMYVHCLSCQCKVSVKPNMGKSNPRVSPCYPSSMFFVWLSGVRQCIVQIHLLESGTFSQTCQVKAAGERSLGQHLCVSVYHLLHPRQLKGHSQPPDRAHLRCPAARVHLLCLMYQEGWCFWDSVLCVWDRTSCAAMVTALQQPAFISSSHLWGTCVFGQFPEETREFFSNCFPSKHLNI